MQLLLANGATAASIPTTDRQYWQLRRANVLFKPGGFLLPGSPKPPSSFFGWGYSLHSVAWTSTPRHAPEDWDNTGKCVKNTEKISPVRTYFRLFWFSSGVLIFSHLS